MFEEAGIWGFVIIGGPVLLLLAFIWARTRSGKMNERIDPHRSMSDPSKGMHPSDRATRR